MHGVSFGRMSDPKRKRKPPTGQRKQMSGPWKALVKSKLAENLRDAKHPKDQAELADLIGVDRSAITKMLKAVSSKLVDQVSAALGIPPPMIETPTDEDPLIALVNRMDSKQRARALAVLRALVD